MHDSLALVPRETPEQDSTIVREWLRSKRSAHTQRAYARDIAIFYERVRKPLHQVTLTDMQDYADWLTREHTEVSTVSRMLAAVKSLLTFAKDTGYIPFNPGKALQLPQGKDKLAQRIFSQAQVQRMLYVTEKSGNERNYILLLLLYSSGIRCAELCGLQWNSTPTSALTTYTRAKTGSSNPIKANGAGREWSRLPGLISSNLNTSRMASS
jgi:site-specific recombinase XerD